uniref:DUF148 domain-containing protein n=1 Tax=Strongyloides papillosus TaxID=174720 RepID=A0A0N5BJ80_STREA
MKLFLIFFTIFINLIESSLKDVNNIMKILEKNSINETIPLLKPNRIFQKNLLSLNEVSGNLSLQDKNILLEKLFLRDQEMEKLIQKFTQSNPIIMKYSSHNSSKLHSNATTLPHQTLFIKDGFVERKQNDSNFKAIIKDSNMQSVFKNQILDNDLIAKYKIPPFLIRADLDKELKIQKQVLKTPRLLARIHSRTEDLKNEEKTDFQRLNSSILNIKESDYSVKSVTKILENNKKVAASKLNNILDKFKATGKQKTNKNTKKQFFHAPPEIVPKKSTKTFYNQIHSTNDKSSTFNVRKMSRPNKEIDNVILKDKSRW